jgi:hypothetical protein
MNETTKILPAIAIRSVATGLLMMTAFTGLWTGIAFGAGLSGSSYQYILIVFVIFMIIFLVQAIRFFRLARKYPSIKSSEERAEGKKTGMWFGIIFGAEGLLIVVAINIVNHFGHPDLSIPAIALVVGLHFFPLAKVFKRKIDYWLASWTVLIALLGIIFTLNKTISPPGIAAFVGIGVAIATSGYGLYMIYYGRKMIRSNIQF